MDNKNIYKLSAWRHGLYSVTTKCTQDDRLPLN